MLSTGFTVTVDQNITIDETVLRVDAILQVLDGVTVTLNDGAGTDLNHAAGSTIHIFGEGHISGTGSALFAGNLLVYSVNGTGAITSGIGATGNIRISSRSYKSSCSLTYASSQRQYIGNGHPAEVTTVINNAAGVELNNTSSGTVFFTGPILVNSGELLAGNDNLNATAAIQINGGVLTLSSTSAGGRNHALGQVVLNTGSLNISTVSAVSNCSVVFNGSVNLSGGDMVLTSGAFEIFTRFNSDIQGSGNIQASGSNNTIRIFGSGALSNQTPFANGATAKLVIFNRSGGSLLLDQPVAFNRFDVVAGSVSTSANQIFNGPLSLASGTTFNFSNASIELRSTVNSNYSGGQFQSNATSSLSITYTGAVTSLGFAPGSALASFTLDRTVSITPTSTISIQSSINLLRGTLNNSAGISMANGSSFVRSSNALLTGATPSGGPYNITYTDGSLTTGPEVSGSVGNILVNGSGTVTLAAPLTASGDLTINSGGLDAGSFALSLNSLQNQGIFVAPASTLTVTGNIINEGQFMNNSGTIAFQGSGLQSIDGAQPITFNNIEVGSNASIAFETPHSVRGQVSISDGAALDADGVLDGGRLTLLSSSEEAADNASIGEIPATATVVGDFTVQRYLSEIDNVHRFFSSPITNATVAQLQDDFSVTGQFTGSSYPCTGCDNNGSSMHWFDESLGGAFNSRYAPIPSINGTNDELLVPGRGYDAYMWNGTGGTRIDFTGPINQGEVDFGPLTYTASTTPDPSTDGWHLLGNPYPSTLDWTNGEGWSRSNIDPTVWVWDEGGQLWRSYHLTNGGNLPNGLLASGQAFWVRAGLGGGTLTVNENAKSQASGRYYREKESHVVNSGLKILVSNGSVRDEAHLIENDEATMDFDQGLDSYKLRLGIESISLGIVDPKEGSTLAYSFVPPGQHLSIVPFSLALAAEGEYSFEFQNLADENNMIDRFMIWDKHLNRFQELSTKYLFTISSQEQGSGSRDRFALVAKEPINVSERELSVELYPNPASDIVNIMVNRDDVVEIGIFTHLGVKIYSTSFTKDSGITTASLSMSSLPAGVYMVKTLFSKNQVSVKKLIKQ